MPTGSVRRRELIVSMSVPNRKQYFYNNTNINGNLRCSSNFDFKHSSIKKKNIKIIVDRRLWLSFLNIDRCRLDSWEQHGKKTVGKTGIFTDNLHTLYSRYCFILFFQYAFFSIYLYCVCTCTYVFFYIYLIAFKIFDCVYYSYCAVRQLVSFYLILCF